MQRNQQAIAGVIKALNEICTPGQTAGASECPDPNNGDCLDLACAAAYVLSSLGVGAKISVLERYLENDLDAVVHAVCVSDGLFIGADVSADINNLNEHMDFLESELEFEKQRARSGYGEDPGEAWHSIREFEIDMIDIEPFRILSEAYAENMKNNRAERILNLDRVDFYTKSILGILGLGKAIDSAVVKDLLMTNTSASACVAKKPGNHL